MSAVDCSYFDILPVQPSGLSKKYKIVEHPNKEIGERLTLLDILRDANAFGYKRIMIRSDGKENFISSSEFESIRNNCYNDVIKLNIRSFEQIAPSKQENNRAPVSVLLQGGLGNRLYQLFSILAFALRHNRPFVIDPRFIAPNGHSKIDYKYLYEKYIGNIGGSIGIFEERYEDCWNFLDLNPLADKELPILFKGFYQSHLYFDEIKPLIQSSFLKPSEKDQKYIADKYGDLSNAVFIHYRLTDNTPNNPKHYMLQELLAYYPKAIRKMYDKIGKPDTEIRFMIISDEFPRMEKDYAESLAMLKNKTYVKEDEIISLYIMNQCKLGGICANSTYSWWGGYLNPGFVISPSRYMTDPKVQPKNLATYFPNGWEIITI